MVQLVAAALDVQALPGRSLGDAVGDFVASRTLLLVLDNCEHVLSSAARGLVRRLLRGAPQLRILTTSREPLRVPGETVFVVPSLTIPNPEVPLPPSKLRRFEGVRLFVERAAGVSPGFDLNATNAGDVARICFRLDGLPLALELAAARLGALAPAAIAERLDDRFGLLRAGNRAAHTPADSRSNALLEPRATRRRTKQTLFRRLAAFSASFDLEAAETVCAGDGLPAEDGPTSSRTSSRSLSSRPTTAALSGATGCWRPSGRTPAGGSKRPASRRPSRDGSRTGRCCWRSGSAGQRGSMWTHRTSGAPWSPDGRRSEAALRLCVALWPFWLRRIDLDEAHRRFDEALAAVSKRTRLRAEGLLASVALEVRAGKFGQQDARALESLSIAEELEDARLQWRALHMLGGAAVTYYDGHAAVAWFERARRLARAEGLTTAEASSLHSLGVAHWRLNNDSRAEELIVESVAAFRAGRLDGNDPGADERHRDPQPRPPTDRFRRHVPALRRGDRRTGIRLRGRRPRRDPARVRRPRASASAARRRPAALRLARRRARASGRPAAPRPPRGRGRLAGRGALPSGARPRAAQADERPPRRRDGTRGARPRRDGGRRLRAGGAAARRGARPLPPRRRLLGADELLWTTADLAVARGDLDAAEAALEDALASRTGGGRDRWHAETLARLAEVALIRNDRQRAAALFTEARERFVSGYDDAAAAGIDERLRALAKPRKESPARFAGESEC